MKCFGADLSIKQLDRQGFKFSHKLMGHPALSLENLSRVIPALPKEYVMYSKSLLQNGDDFESTFRDRPQGVSIEQTIETIRASNSYIMVRNPEVAPSFQPLFQDLLQDVRELVDARVPGSSVLAPKLYLFIASPNSVTPFHIDRYSTFLMQFRGTKEVTVFDPLDERVVGAKDRENYMTHADTHLPWNPDIDSHGVRHVFSPGEALHIPFTAGHHVKNGADDVSISMSIIFNTEESIRWRDALCFNRISRRMLDRVGMEPSPPGQSIWRDASRASFYRAISATTRVLRRK